MKRLRLPRWPGVVAPSRGDRPTRGDSLSLNVFLALMLLGAAGVPATGGDALLQVRAVHDVPGAVEIGVQGWDVHGDLVDDFTLTYDNNDNVFGVEAETISKKTRVLRLTFLNDFFIGPGDLDRNAFIDAFWVNNLRYEAEHFDRTGGPDFFFPGCAATNTTDATGEIAGIADCGNRGDWVEFDLHPGNPVGSTQGQGKGPKAKSPPGLDKADSGTGLDLDAAETVGSIQKPGKGPKDKVAPGHDRRRQPQTSRRR